MLKVAGTSSTSITYLRAQVLRGLVPVLAAACGSPEGVAVDALGDSSVVSIDGANDKLYSQTAYIKAAYVFRDSEAGWAQEAYIKASNADANDRFGGDLFATETGSPSIALSADGSVLIVGAARTLGWR